MKDNSSHSPLEISAEIHPATFVNTREFASECFLLPDHSIHTQKLIQNVICDLFDPEF